MTDHDKQEAESLADWLDGVGTGVSNVRFARVTITEDAR